VRYFLKVRGDEQSVTNSGRLFHARGSATAKARSPSDERRVAGSLAPQERMTMQTAVDDATLLQQPAQTPFLRFVVQQSNNILPLSHSRLATNVTNSVFLRYKGHTVHAAVKYIRTKPLPEEFSEYLLPVCRNIVSGWAHKQLWDKNLIGALQLYLRRPDARSRNLYKPCQAYVSRWWSQ